MDKNEHVYIKLQRHIDNQAIGFPSTKSGSEIRILKHIFTPIEAEIATCLTYRPEPLEKIFERAGYLVESPEKLSQMLDCIENKGGIESKVKDGKRLYCNAPLVVGMYEHQLGKLTPGFIKDFNEYVSDKRFGIAFISTKLPQMRTIPIAESIQPQHNVSTFDEVAVLLQQAEAPFAVFECICRQKKSLEDKPCQVTDRKETCFAFGSTAQAVLRRGSGREITLDETMSILEQNQKQGLVLQPSNTQKAEFICSCCGCCCGILSMHKSLPKPLNFWASNFYAVIDTDACDACGICETRCQAGAASVSEKTQQSSIDLNRCIGCGICIPACPPKAISLQKKPAEVKPPQTREDLYDIIMSHKKGKLGKLKVTGKLFIDASLTGQTHLLK
ncbi:MAG: 4Fe-4S ferredoxin [Desulfobacterium sp.]|nr:4Fe-4S ferredoxin [Desulfobacterium sp.]MBU3950326.1 4Fe-4S binding protein [Pseudomonadota bacterium]MBU4036815.1 4Fe-4S binding protein [Pseudomonadota bacterium]